VVLALVVPLLLGAGVALLAGRPLAFAVIHRLTARKFPDLHWIDTDELARWREDPAKSQPVLLDARTADEYAVSHLKNAARIDPYRPLLRPLRGFPKDTPVVIYSSVGYRGARVANWLSGLGYTRVTTLDGSLFQWANEGRPVFRDDRPVLEVHPYDHRWGLLLESHYRIEAPDVDKRSAAP
jgi:rhodanese-related sulfurtransferase